MPKNTPILVTGVPGNVGSVGLSVVKLLRDRDLPVRALVRRLDERSQALSEMGAELVVADLTNGADVVRALRGFSTMGKLHSENRYDRLTSDVQKLTGKPGRV